MARGGGGDGTLLVLVVVGLGYAVLKRNGLIGPGGLLPVVGSAPAPPSPDAPAAPSRPSLPGPYAPPISYTPSPSDPFGPIGGSPRIGIADPGAGLTTSPGGRNVWYAPPASGLADGPAPPATIGPDDPFGPIGGSGKAF
jgi:hypothetical protein